MDCNIIQDLIPLYIDECCSGESAALVRDHLAVCPACRAVYDSMNKEPENQESLSAPMKMSRVNDWKASILQSVLLYLSFAVITVGVALEAASPTGLANGFWAFTLVIPATGFMLSLANWYFIRVYRSRKLFSRFSMWLNIVITLASFIWAGFHYECSIIDYGKLLLSLPFSDFAEAVYGITLLYRWGILLSVVCALLSRFLSNRFAKLLGKE